MTVVDPGTETRLVEIKGRPIVVRQLKDAQLALMVREGRLLQRASTDTARKVAALGHIMDLFESAVVQPEDIDYIIQLNINGKLELADMFGFITAFKAEPEPAHPVARRGRPPRAR